MTTAPITRHDPRYLVHNDDPSAVLVGWWNDLPMGAWTDDNSEAFFAAIADELKHAVGDDFDTNHISIQEA
jgi:hypothetical protein